MLLQFVPIENISVQKTSVIHLVYLGCVDVCRYRTAANYVLGVILTIFAVKYIYSYKMNDSQIIPPTTSAQNETTTIGTLVSDPGGFPTWAIICIILGIIVLICLSLLLAYFLIRRIQDRRRNHGEYRPQLEETIHAKNLPYISPPNIEGLI